MIDRSKLNKVEREAGISPPLQALLDVLEVTFPLYDFQASGTTHRYEDGEAVYTVSDVNVILNGEVLGSVGETGRYRDGKYQMCTYIRSHRISKSRGTHDCKLSKDIKVLAREAKKVFVSKSNSELIDQLKDTIQRHVRNVENSYQNEIIWNVNISGIGFEYLTNQYIALSNWQENLIVSIDKSLFTPELKTKYSKYLESKKLNDKCAHDIGYAVLTLLDGSFVVYDMKENHISKVKDISLMPIHMQNKLSVLKILGDAEIVSNMGMWFKHENEQRLYYLVDGEVLTEQ